MIRHLCLLLCCSALALQALEILDPEEVEYIRSRASASVGGAVRLDCGSAAPAVFIWGFTKPGTDTNVALAYNYGRAARLQQPSGGPGAARLSVDGSALVLEGLGREAAGMYTCQALYDTDDGARIAFYFTQLDIEDN